MLDGDRRRLALAYSVLFSLPGTPVLFYGEEIGLGENPEGEGRMAVRVPMQWTASGGFSPVAERTPVSTPAGPYGPREVNVEAQRRDPDSLLRWITLLIERYRESPELAWGAYRVLETADEAVLVHRADAEGGTVVAVHNFADREARAEFVLDGLDEGQMLTDLLVDGTLDLPPDGRVSFTLEPYGTRWLRVSAPDEPLEDASAKGS
ncbi:hypothetical protein [Streptosporangium sp. NPDC020145]